MDLITDTIAAVAIIAVVVGVLSFGGMLVWAFIQPWLVVFGAA